MLLALEFEFWIRNLLRFPVKAGQEHLNSEETRGLQAECREFIEAGLSSYRKVLSETLPDEFVTLDIGCKNFFLGPVIETIFEDLGKHPEIHGIEIDAFRRYHNLRSRADYARGFARQMKRGTFHPINVERWTTPSDFIFLLNPFVTIQPHLKWGLPKRLFRPAPFFEHVVGLVRPGGWILSSSPTDAERLEVRKLAIENGMKQAHQWRWNSKAEGAQKQDRFGLLLRKPQS